MDLFDDYLYEYYNDCLEEELGNYHPGELQDEINQCYEEYELHKDVEALLEERSWESSLRYIQIRRIAKEAREKEIQTPVIFKFFKEYNITEKERVLFWMEFYF